MFDFTLNFAFPTQEETQTRSFLHVSNNAASGDDDIVTKHLFPSATRLENGGSGGGFDVDGDEGLRSNFQKRQQLLKRSRRGPRSRSSQYRGVTFYRRTGRWESHIWFSLNYMNFFPCLFYKLLKLFFLLVILFVFCRDNGKQVYLGKYEFFSINDALFYDAPVFA